MQSKKWEHITEDILKVMKEELTIDESEFEDWLSDEENVFRCHQCKNKYPFFIANFDGLGGKFCSQKCSMRGSENLEKYQ